MAITNELHKVLIFIADPTTILVDYDRVVLYKSTTGSSGDYQAILASAAAAATLKGLKKETFDLNGKSFKFKEDGVEKTATFTTETTAAQVAAKITTDTGVTAADDGGYIKLTSGTTGLASTIQIHESTEGGVILGFYTGAYDIGEGLWITIVGGTKLYVQDDPHSDNGYWYMTKYVNSGTLIESEFSAPFQARPLGALDPDDIIYGTGIIVDLEGNPEAGRNIVVYNRYVPTVVSNALIDGPETRIYQTDDQGLVAIPFVKGSKISVGIENTKLRRDIDVPTTGDSFDLFDQALLDDRLGITYYPIVDAERTTL
jgi:hypothetical protein